MFLKHLINPRPSIMLLFFVFCIAFAVFPLLDSEASILFKHLHLPPVVILFSGIIIQVGFLDSLTTNCDHSLPLTLGELTEFGDAKRNIEHWKYIKSYSPYHNIKKIDYPNLLLVTNLKDVRVLFDEPTKFTAKLRQYKTDNNLLLLKCELEDAGHGGKSGRDSAIEEIAFDYSFILKIANKLNT